jgi:cytochrome c oxidase assembly protein subunit 15
VHRAFFWLLAVLVPLTWWLGRASWTGHALLGAFALQATLGIATLLSGVPVALGAAHQGGAVVLLAASIWNAHRLGRIAR